MTTAKPILRFPGSKWKIADWIISQMPPHEVYLEPFFGSGAIFFKKQPSKTETINDINGHVVNLFRVLRDNPLELIEKIELTPWARDEYMAIARGSDLIVMTNDPFENARRFLVRCWQSYGARLNCRAGWAHDTTGSISKPRLWSKLPERILNIVSRLKQAQIENRSAVDLISAYHAKNVLIYADPPYLLATRRNRKIYSDEMQDGEHMNLLDVLDKHPGPVMLSGYSCPLYNERLKYWNKLERKGFAEKGQARIETLWLNKAVRSNLNE